MTTTTEFAEVIAEALYESEYAEGVERVDTFADRGLLTMNDGLVVRMEDGTEFQLTVVQSR